jgi:hypothetical protein
MSEGTEENHEKPEPGQPLSENSNPKHSEYEARVLTTKP